MLTTKKFSLVALIIGMILLTSCSSANSKSNEDILSSQPTENIDSKQTSNGPIAGIVEFATANEENFLRMYFQLQDYQSRRIPSDGTLTVKIFDQLDTVLYEDTLEVSSSNFMDYFFKLTGQSMGAVYEWKVPFKIIDKGFTDYGYSKIIFAKDGRTFEATTEFIDIPTYTEKEILDLKEKEYESSRVAIGKNSKKGALDITLQHYGFYNKIFFLDEHKEFFRIDMIIKVRGSDSHYFFPSKIKLIDNHGNQYDSSYESTLKSQDMLSGTKQEGYILFENVPKDILSAKLLIPVGRDAAYREMFYDYDIELV